MKFLVKIEQGINQLIFKLIEVLWRFMPAPIKRLCQRASAWNVHLKMRLRQLPGKLKLWLIQFVAHLKQTLQTLNIKTLLTESYKKAKFQTTGKSTDKFHKLKSLFLTPVVIFSNWVQGLSPAQSMLLLLFTSLSVLSAISIGLEGKRIVDAQVNTSRSPASSEEVEYDRPKYYKKQLRHLNVTNFRLPVYVAELNQVRTVDIDFSATLSNRSARKFLEKHEFQLRDHLILQLEPSIASFPLEEEGKEIIRNILLVEINHFLSLQKVQGEVTEIKITYVLAN